MDKLGLVYVVFAIIDMIVLCELIAEVWENSDIPTKKSGGSRNTSSQTIRQVVNKYPG